MKPPVNDFNVHANTRVHINRIVDGKQSQTLDNVMSMTLAV